VLGLNSRASHGGPHARHRTGLKETKQFQVALNYFM
jgi:hypothetical protein